MLPSVIRLQQQHIMHYNICENSNKKSIEKIENNYACICILFVFVFVFAEQTCSSLRRSKCESKLSNEIKSNNKSNKNSNNNNGNGQQQQIRQQNVYQGAAAQQSSYKYGKSRKYHVKSINNTNLQTKWPLDSNQS